MSTDHKRAKIAESIVPGITGPYGCFNSPELTGWVNGEEWVIDDYFTSYDASAHIRAALTQDERINFILELETIVGAESDSEGFSSDQIFKIVNATPDQQTEAFAKVRNLW